VVCLLFAAWLTQWTNKLLLVRGLSAKATVDELGPTFPGAEEIVVVKDTSMMYPHVGRRKENAAIVNRSDG